MISHATEPQRSVRPLFFVIATFGAGALFGLLLNATMPKNLEPTPAPVRVIAAFDRTASHHNSIEDSTSANKKRIHIAADATRVVKSNPDDLRVLRDALTAIAGTAPSVTNPQAEDSSDILDWNRWARLNDPSGQIVNSGSPEGSSRR